MPRANSRSSASATASFSPISSTVLGQAAVAQARLEHPQVQRERDELLLRAVVQVALDPPARVVGRLDDPQPRHPQLLHPRAQLGLQALVVDRQRGGGGGRGDELRRRVELGVVDDRRQPHAPAVDRGPGAAGAGVGQLDRAAGVVDEDLALGQPVGDVERAVAEPLGQHLAHRAALGDARAQQPARERAQRRADALERGDRDDRRRQREQAEREPDAPGRAPTARRAARRRPPARSRRGPPARSPAARAARRATSPTSAIGSLSSSIPRSAPERPVAELRAHAARRAAGSTGGRCVSSSRLAWRRSPSASRHVSRAVPARIGSPTHSGASTTPSTSPPPITSR